MPGQGPPGSLMTSGVMVGPERLRGLEGTPSGRTGGFLTGAAAPWSLRVTKGRYLGLVSLGRHPADLGHLPSRLTSEPHTQVPRPP